MFLWLMNLDFAGGTAPPAAATVAEGLYARVDEGQEDFRRSAESDLTYPRLDDGPDSFRRV